MPGFRDESESKRSGASTFRIGSDAERSNAQTRPQAGGNLIGGRCENHTSGT
jgi:hypothetical protein